MEPIRVGIIGFGRSGCSIHANAICKMRDRFNIVLGVNPFDQPGVEAYKKNMFALLGKPGYEKSREELEARLATLN